MKTSQPQRRIERNGGVERRSVVEMLFATARSSRLHPDEKMSGLRPN